MHRPRSLLLLVAVVASLLACEAPALRSTPATSLDPYSDARSGVVPARVQAATAQPTSPGPAPLRESRRMCQLRGDKGSC